MRLVLGFMILYFAASVQTLVTVDSREDANSARGFLIGQTTVSAIIAAALSVLVVLQ